MRQEYIVGIIVGKKIANKIIKIYKAIKGMNQVFLDLIIHYKTNKLI